MTEETNEKMMMILDLTTGSVLKVTQKEYKENYGRWKFLPGATHILNNQKDEQQ